MPHPALPQAFVILADLRTGSTLLSSSLNTHPDLRCLGELLHHRDFADNQLPALNRHQLHGPALVARALTGSDNLAAGFRAMVSLPDTAARPKWAGAWQTLAAWPGLRVIVLRREDHLAQFASYCLALRTGCFTPSPEDPLLRPENRPRLYLQPAELAAWIRQRRHLYARRLALLGHKPCLHLSYETLIRDWPGQIRRIQGFLGLPPRRLEQVKVQQESRPLHEVVINFDQLRTN